MKIQKSFLRGALAIFLIFLCHSETVAGPNRFARIGLDIDATPDAINNGNTTATVNGRDPIVVEIFASPLAGPIVGARFLFDIDQRVLQVNSFSNAYNVSGTMFALGAAGNEVSLGALPSATLTAGAFGAVTFTPQRDLTGIPFSIGVISFTVVDAGGAADTLRTTDRLWFNSDGSGQLLTLNAGVSGSREVAAPSAGDTFEIRLSVPEAASKSIFGYSISFDNTYSGFSLYFSISAAKDWRGTDLVLTNNGTTFSALLISNPVVSSSGYIGTITLRANRDVPKGHVLQFDASQSTMGMNEVENLLNVSGASITFKESAIRAIAGDFDWDGDVDFADFVVFTRNFGSEGPVPNAPYLPPGK